MKTLIYSFMAAMLLALSCDKKEDQQLNISSPGNQVSIGFFLLENGQPAYTAHFGGQLAIDTSVLGLRLKGIPLYRDLQVLNTSNRSHDERWEQPWGEQRLIRDNHNELKVELGNREGHSMNIIFRVFDDGFAFRYELPQQEKLGEFEVMDEMTEFKLSGNYPAWWIPAYAGNRYEYLYRKDPVNRLKRVHTPLTIEAGENLFMSIHEAALIDYSSMVLKSTGRNTLKCDLVPWSKKDSVKSYNNTPFATPWRTVQIAEKPGDLVTNYMILNLNEPSKIGNVPWFKPGKYVGIWWEMHINTGTWHQGEKHAATTENTKKYIDFAAKHGFDGVLVEGWNYGWDGDWMNGGTKFSFTKNYPDYDIEELSRYGKEKGVYIIGHHETGADVENYESQLDQAFQFLEDHGIKAVKTGYVENGDTLANGIYHHGQYYVRHFRKVMETAAEHQVAIVAHEPIKDTGERRTYPNMISREGARGQEYNAWGENGGNPPNHVTILPFTRLLAGPMDYTPGVFDLELPTQPENQVNHTLAKELALYVVIYAPMQMACDLPENYEGHPAFQFIKDVGVDWETTKAIDGKIGGYITVARQQRGSDNWFLGGITNEDPRKYSVILDFLQEGKTYNATIYADAEDAHYLENPTAYKIEKRQVTAGDTLDINLAPGGGVAVSLMAVE